MSRLLTLSSAASYVHPASVSPDNALGLTFDPETPLSPLVLPSHAQSDPVYTSLPQPQEEGATISSVLSSPSYHVQSPPSSHHPHTTFSLLHPLLHHHPFRPLWLLVVQAPHLPSLLLLLLLHRKRQTLITKRIVLPHPVRSSSLTHTLLQCAPRTYPAATHISITLSTIKTVTLGNQSLTETPSPS